MTKKSQAVFVATLVICSVFAGTVVFTQNTVASQPSYTGGAVHYLNSSDDAVVEIPFEGELNQASITQDNFTLLDNGDPVSYETIQYQEGTVYLVVDTGASTGSGSLIFSQDLEVNISSEVTDGKELVTNPGEKSVTVASQTVVFDTNGTGSVISPDNQIVFQGSTVAISITDNGEPKYDTSVTVEGEDGNFFFEGGTGRNSSVFTFDTSDRDLGEYRVYIQGSDTEASRSFIVVRDLQMDITLDTRSLASNDPIEGTVSAVAANRKIAVNLINESGSVVGNQTGRLDGQGEFDFNFGVEQREGDYTVQAVDLGSGVIVESTTIPVSSITGNGTQSDPYIITSANGLQAVENEPSAYYELANNINASGTDVWNGGSGFVPIRSFSGVFDGNGHTITGLSINRTNENSVGVFGSITESGTVSDVAVVAVDIAGSDRVGGIAGQNNGNIERTYVAGTIDGDSEVGGVAGDNSGDIVASHSTADVHGQVYVGGLVGYNNNESTVSSSYASGPVTGERLVGGLIGDQQLYSSSVTDSYWDKTRTGQRTSAGGTGLVTAQMKGTAAQENMTGFDFNGTWQTTNHYPVLKVTATESGSVGGVRITAEETNIAAGETATISITVEDTEANIGAVSTTLSLTNSSVGSLTSVTVTGSPDQTNIEYSESNDSVTIEAYGLDVAAQEDLTILQVTVTADEVGTTELQSSNTTLGSASGQDIPVRAESVSAVQTVDLDPVGGFEQAPTDPDGDGEFEDINGDGEITISDVQAFFVNTDDPVIQNNLELFDFSDNGEVNIVDVQRLFIEVV